MPRKKTGPPVPPKDESKGNQTAEELAGLVMYKWNLDQAALDPDPYDTREEDEKKLEVLRKIEYFEAFPPKKIPAGYAAPRFDAIKQHRFLDKLASCGTLTRACAWTPVTAKTIGEWRKKSKEFERLYQRSLEAYADSLEDELLRRATKGVKRPIFQKGFLIGHERQYSDRLMELTMKKHDPSYKEKLDVTANITGGVLAVAVPAKDEKEWRERYGSLQRPNGENGQNYQGQEEKKKDKKKKVDPNVQVIGRQ